MDKRWGVLLAFALLLTLCLPAEALTGEDVLRRQEELIEVDELQRAAEEAPGYFLRIF